MTVSYTGRTCPYCQTALRPDSNAVVCPSCQMPHHRDCWLQNRGCTTYGCPQRAANPAAPQPPMMPPPTPPQGAMPTPPQQQPYGAPPYQQPYGAPQYQQPYAPVQTPCKEASDALMYSIIGLFCLGIVLEPLAIIKALNAKKMIKANPNLTGEGNATAALVIGIISLALMVLTLLVYAIIVIAAVVSES